MILAHIMLSVQLLEYCVVLNITPDYVVVQVVLTVHGEISDICMTCEYLKGDVFFNCSASNKKRSGLPTGVHGYRPDWPHPSTNNKCATSAFDRYVICDTHPLQWMPSLTSHVQGQTQSVYTSISA